MVKNVYSCAPVQVCIGAGKQSADSSCAARVSLPRAGRVAGAREMSATPQAPYRRRRSAKRLKILTHTPNISNIRGRRCGGDGQRVPSHHGTVRGVCRRSLWRVNHLRPAPLAMQKKVNIWTLRKSNRLLKMAPPLVVSTCLTPWQHGGGVGTSTDSVTGMSI